MISVAEYMIFESFLDVAKDKIHNVGQHYLNPLHVRCRLRDCGVSKDKATKISGWYEKNIYDNMPSLGRKPITA